MTPRWKKAGPNGEIEITIKGKKYKIEKALDHNQRHKGEFKIMVWDKRRDEWMWDNTVLGKSYAKELVMDKLDESTSYNCKNCAEYGSEFCKDCLQESVTPHPNVVKAYKKHRDAEDKAADWNYGATKARVTRAANHLSKMIDKHHPGLDMSDKIALRTKLQNMKEEMMTAADAGIPQDTKNMGPRFKAHSVTDRRRKKNKTPVLLKRFRKYMEDNA